ncbi:bacterio-opsin activator domain-containing protein [Halovivax gelatinilyticus]|uniref:bacterio-opsin activator domain-containing protein n=1 Tax=Halovivax gelatinilyticus TaxID=2961597 RepID=UPI0020CA5B02|nr:bacterio-opsin activator domain-containing protein [Halovivax gelatinilyticus]
MPADIDVLLVDNEPSFAQLAAEMLTRADDSLSVTTVTSASNALETVEETPIDCVVSDYDMPGLSGLELLEAVREDNEDLPFVLFTGKGSEEIASEAIAAGVTGYLQKKSGREQYTLLANQIRNAVAQYRAETELRESEKRYERTLTGLHETTRDLMRAGTKGEIFRAAVDTADEILGVPIVATYRFDPTERNLQHAASVSATAEALDPDRTYEHDEGHVWDIFSTGEMGYVPDVQAEVGEDTELRRRSEVIVPLGTHGMLVAGSEARDGFDETTIELIQILAANTEAALDRAEREQLLRDHDRRLTHQNEELTRLNHTNELVREITRGVAQATTREEIETTVCDRLVGGERYLGAWIAPTDDPWSPTARSGIETAYADRISADGESAPEADLARRAIDDERVQVVRNVLDEPAWEPRRSVALTAGFQTVLAVPLIGRDRRYGAVVVHAPAADAVTDREREVLAELGETIGHAIRTAERTRAMVTDERVELELSCTDEQLLFTQLARVLDRTITLEGIVDRADGRIVCFVRVPAYPADEVDSIADELAVVESAAAISEAEESVLVDVTITSTPLLDILAEFDTRLRSVTADGEISSMTVQLPQGVDARSVIEGIQEAYPTTELTARRETTRKHSGGHVNGKIESTLTAKQLEALQSAYYSGFFEWPRESTGEDLAETLDVSAPTLHYHLRAAQRKLVDLTFDDGSN